MLNNKKKIILIIIASFLAVIFIASCIIWCPRKLSNKLPKEKIISIVKEYERVTTQGVELVKVEIAQDKIPEFEEKLNSLWYIKGVSFQKDIHLEYPIYIITYENYTVRFWQYRLRVFHNEKGVVLGQRIFVTFPNDIYKQLETLFLV